MAAGREARGRVLRGPRGTSEPGLGRGEPGRVWVAPGAGPVPVPVPACSRGEASQLRRWSRASEPGGQGGDAKFCGTLFVLELLSRFREEFAKPSAVPAVISLRA